MAWRDVIQGSPELCRPARRPTAPGLRPVAVLPVTARGGVTLRAARVARLISALFAYITRRAPCAADAPGQEPLVAGPSPHLLPDPVLWPRRVVH